jgi:hypothetical protein
MVASQTTKLQHAVQPQISTLNSIGTENFRLKPIPMRLTKFLGGREVANIPNAMCFKNLRPTDIHISNHHETTTSSPQQFFCASLSFFASLSFLFDLFFPMLSVTRSDTHPAIPFHEKLHPAVNSVRLSPAHLLAFASPHHIKHHIGFSWKKIPRFEKKTIITPPFVWPERKVLGVWPTAVF